MARDWNSLFRSWAKPPSETEEEKASRAARMIRAAIHEHEPFKTKRTNVYATGSYRNNTNTRLESDIDVAVVLHDCFFYELPAKGPPTASDLGFKSGGSAYGLPDFRADVERALVAKFGRDGVTRGAKAFNIHENSVRLDADAAVFLVHRRYTGKRRADGSWSYLEGVEMRDGTKRIINWHEQHYRNGVERNIATGRRYKRVVRILKRLRDDMNDNGSSAAKHAATPIPSFLLECLAFNSPDVCFHEGNSDYYSDVCDVVSHCWRETKPEKEALVMREVSRLKWLFSRSQPWTKAQAHAFLLEAWRHAGLKR